MCVEGLGEGVYQCIRQSLCLFLTSTVSFITQGEGDECIPVRLIPLLPSCASLTATR